jgi:serine O-acetyltransferase
VDHIIGKGILMQFTYLAYDLKRYFYPTDNDDECDFINKIRIIIFTQGIWAISIYRFRRWATFECKNRILRRICILLGAIAHLFIEMTTGIHIRPEIDIGLGFYIGHFGNIFLGGETKIGKMCNISQECTVGWGGRGDRHGLPLIGDFVYIAPGAKIFGKIEIGNHVAVGANAVVTTSLPDNAVAGGVPAKIINYKSSKDFINYNKKQFEKVL